jgi:hypothetical protein
MSDLIFGELVYCTEKEEAFVRLNNTFVRFSGDVILIDSLIDCIHSLEQTKELEMQAGRKKAGDVQ